MFSVIEDSFYAPRLGSSSSALSAQLSASPRQDSAAFSSRLGSAAGGWSEDRQQPGQERTKRPKSQVSIASSLGRVEGPDYPYKYRPDNNIGIHIHINTSRYPERIIDCKTNI